MKKIRLIDFSGNEWILNGITYGKRITTFYFLSTRSGVIKVFYRYNCCANYFTDCGGRMQRVRMRDIFPGWDKYGVPV